MLKQELPFNICYCEVIAAKEHIHNILFHYLNTFL